MSLSHFRDHQHWMESHGFGYDQSGRCISVPLLDTEEKIAAFEEARDLWHDELRLRQIRAHKEARELAALGVGADVLCDLFGFQWGSARRIELAARRQRIPTKLKREVLARDGHRCVLCASTAGLEIDHIWPVAKGGPSLAYNLQTLCDPCNSGKRDRIIEVMP